MQTYQQMKDTDVAWLGDIPTEWKALRGKFVYSSRKEPNKNLQEPQRLALTLKGVIERTDGDEVGLNPESLESYQIFEADDLVFKLIDLENKQTSRVGLVPKRGIMSPAYIRLTPKLKVTAKYFFYYYYSLYLNYVYNNIAGGGVRANISAKELLEIEVPMPKLETQNKITDFLDAETAKIDNLIARQENLLELLEEKRLASIALVVTRGLNPNVKLKETGIPWLEKIPAHWKLLRTSVLFTENKTVNDNLVSTTPLQFRFGKIINKDMAEEDDLSDEIRGYVVVKQNDIILNGLNLNYDFVSQRVAIVTESGCITPAYIALRPRSMLNALYACYLLKSMDSQKIFNGLGTGIRLTLNFSEFKKTSLPLPPLSEQEQITTYINNTETRFDTLKQKILAQIDLLKERRISLISNAVTGKIKV